MAETETKTAAQAMGEVYDAMQAETAGPAPAPEPAAEVAPVETAPTATDPPKPERARDEKGRFTEKPEAAPEKEAKPEPAKPAEPVKTTTATEPPKPGATTPTTEKVETPVQTATLRAPQSWSAAAKEAFGKAPAEVQKEVDRREREITKALNDTAAERQFASETRQALGAYQSVAQAHGMDPFQWAGAVLQQFGAPLFSGNPKAAAAAIARAISLSGANVDDINAAMQNPQAAPAPPPQPQVDPREQIRRMLAEERANAEAAAFEADPPEFYETVKPDMLQIIYLDRQRGGNMTPQQAYDRACKISEEVQGALSQRKAAEDAKKKAADIAAAKVASASPRPSPAGPAAPKKMSAKEAMSEVYDKMQAGNVTR